MLAQHHRFEALNELAADLAVSFISLDGYWVNPHVLENVSTCENIALCTVSASEPMLDFLVSGRARERGKEGGSEASREGAGQAGRERGSALLSAARAFGPSWSCSKTVPVLAVVLHTE
eukprot:SAG22_NODE_897_length_6629_cov_4.853446_12_plen_119_part_00